MKAAMRDRHGPPEVVEVREVERPVPTADRCSFGCALRRSIAPTSTASIRAGNSFG
jgi:hypothetical protein